MGLWDSIGSIFSGDSGSDLLKTGLLAGAQYFAADSAADANREAAQIAADAAARQAAEVRAANAAAQERFDQTYAIAEPSIRRLQSISAAPGQLTPQQQAQLDDLRRTTTNSVNRSGLRGSGRAQVAAIRAVESDFVNDALADNQRRADAATSDLARTGFNATTQSAGLDTATGRAAGDAAMTAGLAGAGATTASAGVRGQALADITGLIASDSKGRESRYADRLSALEKNLSVDDEDAV